MAIVLVGNLIARGLGFLFPVVVAGAIGRPDFALAYFFISTGYAVGELILSGYPVALTRAIAAGDRHDRGTTVASAVAAGIPLLVGSMVAAEIVAAAASAPRILASLVVLGLTIDAYYFAVLRGARSFGLLVLYRIGANLVQLVLLGAALLLGVASLAVVVSIYALVYLVPIAVIEVVRAPARRLVRDGGWPRRGEIKELTRVAIPAIVSGTAYAAILGLDVFFVRTLAPSDLADYAAARSLAMPMTLFSFAVGVTLLPHVAAAGPAERRRHLVAAVTATVLLAIAGIVAYMVFGHTVVGLVYPSSYAGAGDVLPMLATAVGLLGLYSVVTQWWIGTGRSIPPAAALVTGAVVAAVTHTLLDPRQGSHGAALAIVIGASTALLLLGAASLRHPDVARP